MSAWDIAGAVVWTGLALSFARSLAFEKRPPDIPEGEWSFARCVVWLLMCGTLLPSVFCIARLLGAHA